MRRLRWPPIIEHAANIVDALDTRPTLRQLFYLLVSDRTIPNAEYPYKRLSDLTAEGRRAGTFPALADLTRHIEVPMSFDGPEDAIEWLVGIYRRDRTELQDHAIYLAVEKATLVGQLSRWFGRDRGIPILALRGYSSQTYIDEVAELIESDGRPAVILYAGDFDPSGEDIERDLSDRLGVEDEIVRVALTPDQVTRFGLPINPGKETDSRANAFERRYGGLWQVEVEALPPDQLRGLFDDALDAVWDVSAFEAVLEQEEEDRDVLQSAAEALP
jgi:hypothetical protein